MPRVHKASAPEQKVKDFLRLHGVAAARKPLVVAVSGGPDSVCLLRILNGLKQELGLRLHVAHLDHGLRKDSPDDAQFVLDLCHRLGVPVTVEQADVNAYRRQHRLTLEEAAREVRYSFLEGVAESIDAKAVAVAHTQDDNVETILLHIIRGAGTRGLAGLQPVTRRDQINIVRPLLNVTRDETVAYCHRHRLQPHLDPTNRDKGPLRNRVRLELLPLLRKYNPAIAEALLRTAAIALDDIAAIDQTTSRRYRTVTSRERDAISLDKVALLKLPTSFQRSLLRRAIADLTGTLKDIEARHIEEVMALLQAPAGRRIDLPYGLRCATDYESIVLHRSDEDLTPYPPLQGSYRLNVPGATDIPGWRIETELVEPARQPRAEGFAAFVAADRIAGDITVRARVPGDRFQPLGMPEEKKLGRFMIDARVPVTSRDRIPIVCCAACAGEQVVWVVGQRIDDRFKLTPQTRRALRITFTRRETRTQ